MTTYVSIGNSDDGLTQAEWARYVEDVDEAIRVNAAVYGRWLSEPASQYQNACWGFQEHANYRGRLRDALRRLAGRYRQQSIAWVEGETDLLTPDGVS